MWPIVQANRSSQGKGTAVKEQSRLRSDLAIHECGDVRPPFFFGSPTTSCLWNTSQAENGNKNLKGEERIPLENWLGIYIYMSLGCCTHVEKGRRGPGYLEIVAVRRGGTKPTHCHPYEAPKPQGVLRVSSTSEHWLNGFLWRMAMDLYVWVMDSSQFLCGLKYFGKHILVHLAT